LKPKIYGEENLDALISMQKDNVLGTVIICNHLSATDPFFVCSLMPLRIRKKLFPIIFLAKKELFVSEKRRIVEKVKDVFMRLIGCIPIGNLSTMREVIKSIKSQENIFIFPEGHVSSDGKIGPDMGALGFLGKHCRFIIQPIIIQGVYPFREDWKNVLLRKRSLSIKFGKPILSEKSIQSDAMEIIKSI